ncbi:MAG: potassium transporter Trk [Micrococcales bacterium]|nr:MAG: potassium transporter Trk [Micrococcales bacterium]PIE25931.1 MAG: potassium transporter Trk [Micrococcales bacterium]
MRLPSTDIATREGQFSSRRERFNRRAQAHPARFALAAFTAVNAFFVALLQLPIATASGQRAPFVDSLFTAVSATCVTGLVTVDTAAYWSTFGHVVILNAIAVGGLGIITIASLLSIMVSARMGLNYRLLAARETKTERLGELGSLLSVVLVTTLAIETVIVAVLFPRLVLAGESVRDALWHSVFYAVSAFNNAGFIIHEGGLPTHPGDWWLTVPIMVGVFLGSLGFPVLLAVRRNLRRPAKWGLHAKLTLSMTTALFLASVVLLGWFEWRNPQTLGQLTPGQKVLAAIFLAVMPRSGGFNTVPTAELEHTSMLLTDAMMFVGGGSVSTAGGIRVTTLAVLFLVIVAESRGDRDVEIFRRRIPTDSLRLAVSVTFVGATLVLIGSLILVETTRVSLDLVLFEVLSAFATCGLSTGLSAELPDAGKYVLTALMFIGRTGTMTLGAALAMRERSRMFRQPEERPIIG